MTSLTWRWLTVAGITLLAGFLLYPSVSWYTLSPAERQDREAHHERPRWLLNLGLDLRGGTHLVMTVEVDKAIESSLDRDAADLKREATEAKIPVDAAVRHDSHIELSLSSSADRNQFNDFVKEHFPNLSIQDSTTRDGRTTLQLIITEQEEKRIRDSALDQSLETIRNRVDQFGVAEPIIQREGDRDILVQLPGIQDPEHAKALIGKTALLEFKLVAKDPSAPGLVTMPLREIDRATGRVSRSEIKVEPRTLMTGDVLTNARPRPGTATEGPHVEFELNARGAKIFEELTGNNVGRQLAIILDGVIQSAPRINDRIRDRGIITGSFTLEEARDLAIVLRAGALPAPVSVIEERTIGPTVGEDSIRAGLTATVLAIAFIFAFMILYYSLAGLVADLALALNLLILLALMSYFGFTLSLPGIAGIVLTMAITVDDNVLIFERIREELALRKSARAAVDRGYERAWTAIRDSLIATGISSICLFQFGTGPIRGFAVTLLLGMLVGRFTAINVTRLIFQTFLARPNINSIRIG